MFQKRIPSPTLWTIAEAAPPPRSFSQWPLPPGPDPLRLTRARTDGGVGVGGAANRQPNASSSAHPSAPTHPPSALLDGLLSRSVSKVKFLPGAEGGGEPGAGEEGVSGEVFYLLFCIRTRTKNLLVEGFKYIVVLCLVLYIEVLIILVRGIQKK